MNDATHPASKDQLCTWKELDPDFGYWQTGCDQAFSVTDGTPEENKFKFCCYCGKTLQQVPFTWPKDEDDE